MSLDTMEYIGLSGGVILAACLIPQIYLVLKTKDVRSISLYWQALYIIGLSATNVYAINDELLAIYTPGCIELFCLLVLTVLKFIYMNSHVNIGQNELQPCVNDACFLHHGNFLECAYPLHHSEPTNDDFTYERSNNHQVDHQTNHQTNNQTNHHDIIV